MATFLLVFKMPATVEINFLFNKIRLKLAENLNIETVKT